jgi:hypothetical protein
VARLRGVEAVPVLVALAPLPETAPGRAVLLRMLLLAGTVERGVGRPRPRARRESPVGLRLLDVLAGLR